jgi:hypothetical protein
MGTQMTQIRLIYTDFPKLDIKNPCKSASSVLSTFLMTKILMEHPETIGRGCYLNKQLPLFSRPYPDIYHFNGNCKRHRAIDIGFRNVEIQTFGNQRHANHY